MNKHHIKLTAEEQILVDKIDLRIEIPHDEDGHAIYLANQKPIIALLESLTNRSAIPESRLKYWADPAFKPGRIKASHKGLFERNGTRGRAIYIHPHFKPYLRYFLFGADLPQKVIDEFESQIGDPRWFGGSDVIALGKKTREIVRRYNLREYQYSDEFHKLAVDNGLSAYDAEYVRKAAVEAARR